MALHLEEKEFQKDILGYLVNDNGYVLRDQANYDRLHAMDEELLFKFLYDTQPNRMAALEKIYKANLKKTIVNFINTECTKTRGSLIEVLKHGIELSSIQLDLMYGKPATSFNKELTAKFDKNILSVMEEVWASDKERIDLVIFLNGLAIITFELKCEAAGQTYRNAIKQYREERDPKTRLFLFKAGVLVNFAMDTDEVYMTTRLNKEKTFFLPFNKGNGEGVNAGKGNPLVKGAKYSTAYMWEDVLKKESLIDLIKRFIFVQDEEIKDEATGKVSHKETLIFPRYHQRDAILKIEQDVRENHTSLNYLIQHSAGSGKTNTIAWLAHRLSSLHDYDDEVIFNNVIIVTDRVVVDRQLQKAVIGMEHKSGLIQVMNEKCTSSDLAHALNGNTKIIATTIQKFPYIVDEVKSLKDKKFAVIIDEAHSSTAGSDMAAVTKSLGSDVQEHEGDTEDKINKDITKHGKQPNVSFFAFTATPKATTLQLFGRENEHGKKQAFHLYSMKQAIEEGFILDVLQNYIEYKTYFELNKVIESDPKFKNNAAKRKVARFIELHETNISQRVEIIIEHFRQVVKDELDGQAKAMVVTASREAAVKYKFAFEKYVKDHGYTDVNSLVAFSGKVALDGKEYTESQINGFPEAQLPKEFNKDQHQVLLVANKYQTGFDQPKLCAMYVLKKLSGVNAVQTLSRLNRICGSDKHTFVLDFVNTQEEIKDSFKPYYTSTILGNNITPSAVYDLEAKIDAYCIIDQRDVEDVNELLYGENRNTVTKKSLNNLFKTAVKKYEALEEKDRKEAKATMRGFVRFYQFLIQVSSFSDTELHKKFNYIFQLITYLKSDEPGPGFTLDDKIKARNFVQKKIKETSKSNLIAQPVINLPTAEHFGLTEDTFKKLSEIVEEINSRVGKNYDTDVVAKSMLQIRDIMKKSDTLKASAKVNSEQDFAQAFFDNVDDALVQGFEQNKDFFSLLLDKDDIKKNVLGIFIPELYKVFRQGNEDQNNNQ